VNRVFRFCSHENEINTENFVVHFSKNDYGFHLGKIKDSCPINALPHIIQHNDMLPVPILPVYTLLKIDILQIYYL